MIILSVLEEEYYRLHKKISLLFDLIYTTAPLIIYYNKNKLVIYLSKENEFLKNGMIRL
ncbi:hypothetical protein CLA01_14660 [Chryseobacterium lathyri]|jgi:hypothetical protein|uniref:Uncharacterized protein n=1 Tax=Chryseobacterium lathyri TaxID=395933 RepID=A0A511Y875_9FLAO|nr:hypothetical protein CLA01_14660 [Chryseobacterium lathyri]